LAVTELVTSKSAARRTIVEAGAYLNNARVDDVDFIPTTADLIHGRWLVLRRGKRAVAGVRVER
jgi:tyrosyl-tRNA synthetase